jgi:hypothetical protein
VASNEPKLENLADLFFASEAQQIYHTVQYEADVTIQKIHQAEKSIELDLEKGKSLRGRVKENLEEASALRFTLNTVDRKIQREKNTDPIIKKHCDDRRRQGLEVTLETLIDYLDEVEQNQLALRAQRTIATMEPLLTESIENRVKIAWCLDGILEVQRSILVDRMISMAHRLTEIAILLQDNQTIQDVRKMLKSLDLTIPPKSTNMPSLKGSPQELKNALKEGIQTMEKTNQDIQKLDNQRQDLKQAIREYGGELGSDPIDTGPVQPIQQPVHESSKKQPKNRSGGGMAFHQKRR